MKVVVGVLIGLCLCGIAFAETTGTTWLHSHSYTDKDSFVDRYSEYQEKQGWAIGLGSDIVVYQFDGSDSINSFMNNKLGMEEVTVEQRWDMNNGTAGVYGVVRINAYKAVKGFLGLN